MKHHFGIALRLSCLALAIFGFSVAISAQTVTGTLQGTVSDTKGAVVPGVDLVVRNLETGQERK